MAGLLAYASVSSSCNTSLLTSSLFLPSLDASSSYDFCKSAPVSNFSFNQSGLVGSATDSVTLGGAVVSVGVSVADSVGVTCSSLIVLTSLHDLYV